MTPPSIIREEKDEETSGAEKKSSLESTTNTVGDESFYVSLSELSFCDTLTVVDQVDFTEGDGRNPVNFSHLRKWVMTVTACAFGGITGKSKRAASGCPFLPI